MAIVDVKVPQLSESVAEATLLQWKKKPGDAVAIDEILIEIETDKVVLEVPAPSAGVLGEIVVADGGTVTADQVIAKIDTEAKPAAGAPAAGAPAGRGAGRGGFQRVVKYAWAPKPIKPTGWTGVNKPVHRIADILAAHKGQARWTQEIVHDQDYSGKWISMAPGDKIGPQFYADDRVMMVVYSGQLRISIEGQEPFVAGPGFLVTIPYRNTYTMEVVGNAPAVRFEVNGVDRQPFIPTTHQANDKPADPKGFVMTRLSWAGGGASYENPDPKATANTRPYLDFNKEVVQGGGRGGAFVSENGNFMNVINQPGRPTPPDDNLGHWHTDYNEFWYIAQGTVDYKMEGIPVIHATVGDVVYAPQGMYHRASGGGTGMSTRIAINPRPEGLHNYHADAEARQ